MPLMIEGGRVPPRWARDGARPARGPAGALPAGDTPKDKLNVALINNMPDAALEDTELQFFDLLDDASGDLPIYLKLYSLTGIPRTERGQRHLASYYFPLDELWQNQIDGVIITGTEPRQPNLKDEPYWQVLANIFDWAERSTISAVLSCLAAHASVLHSDGISRHRLPDKQFGVFTFAKSASHELISGTEEQIRFSHSRWNEVQADALTDAGYRVLTQSAEGGVDTFVKEKKQSLFVHFQGHPEYGAETLLKEYRRDIRRFLRKERETYPSMPRSYFGAAGEKLMANFREAVLADRDQREELMERFPDTAVAGTLQRTWHSASNTMYRNWLSYIVSAKKDISKPSAATVLPANGRGKSAASPGSISRK